MCIIGKLKLRLIVIPLIVLIIIANEAFTQKCSSNELSASYLDTALVMLIKARDHNLKVAEITQPYDCADVLSLGNNASGIYSIWPRNRVMEGRSIEVYCDMVTDGGGWTVIQRRGDFQTADDYFYKDWESYKKGFGDLDKDFWLGNDNIFAISNQKEYSIRFDLRDFEGNSSYALYDSFWIDDEYRKYMLHIKDYRGDAGDRLYPYHDKQEFSTKDRDNDMQNYTLSCAVAVKGAWWYNACYHSNLNGIYLRGKYEPHLHGVCWKACKGSKESLESTEMKIRPKDFQRNHRFTPTRS